MSKRIGRYFAPFVAVGVVAGTAAVPANAAEAIGTQNADLTVTVRIAPDCSASGGSQTRYFAVTNKTAKGQKVTVEWRVTRPGLQTDRFTYRVIIAPGRTWVKEDRTVTLATDCPTGTWTESLSATNRRGTSSASVTYEIASSCG